MAIIEEIVLTIMDWLEDFFGSLTSIEDSKVYKALYLTVGSFCLGIISKLLHIPMFISWEEGLMAVGVNLCMVLTSYIARNGIKELRNKIGGSKNGKSE